MSRSRWNLKSFSKTLSKSSAVLVLSVVLISVTIAYQTSPSYAESVSILDIESLFEQYENNLITSDEFAGKLEQLGWTEPAIRQALTLHQEWIDTDSLGSHAASPMVKGVELLTLNEPKIESVSEQKELVRHVEKESVKQVENEHVDYDESGTKSSQELVMSQEKASSAASSESIKDMMYVMIIAGVVIVAGLIIAAVKKEII